MSEADSHSDSIRHLQCMEIWGGNRAIDSGIKVPGIRAHVFSEPLGPGNAGGDIHYISTCGGGRIARFAVVDVAGHGEAADELARLLRRLMRRYINRLDQTKFIRRLNRAFARLSDDGHFATALLTTYWAPTDHLLMCNAGHPRPLLRRADTGRWSFLHHDTPDAEGRFANLPLGVIHPTDYHQFAVRLCKDDLVLLYTDSLTEARHPTRGLLGDEGLLNMVREINCDDPERFCRTLLTRLREYRDGAPAEDDTTVMLLHHTADGIPSKSFGEMATVLGKLMGLVKV